MDPTNWLQNLLYRGKDETTGNTLAQDLIQKGFGKYPAAGMYFLKNKAAPAIGNFIFGDPNTTLDGAPMPGGYNQDYLNSPYETRKRFDESMMN